MSNLSLFLKKNKKARENVKYAATKSLCDENGSPLEWEIKPLNSREYDQLMADCSDDKGKMDWVMFRERLVTACVAEPNLNSSELQDSYGVMSAEDLLRAMVDDPSEFSAFYKFADNMSSSGNIDEKIEQAKN